MRLALTNLGCEGFDFWGHLRTAFVEDPIDSDRAAEHDRPKLVAVDLSVMLVPEWPQIDDVLDTDSAVG